MKKLSVLFVMLSAFVLISLVASCDNGTKDETLSPVSLTSDVVITESGKKYHRKDSDYNNKRCSTIKNSTLTYISHQKQ